VDNQVKRNDKRSILHSTEEALGVSLIADIKNPGLVHSPIANVEKPVTVSTIFDSVATSKKCSFVTTDEQCCSQPTKTHKTVTFKDLQELFTELIRLALSQGRESLKTLYGAGIQILNLLKCPSTDIQVPVDKVISRYQSTFTPTNEVTFTSSCMPIPKKPKPKTGSRDTETRIRKSGDIPKGSCRIARCSVCGASGPEPNHSTITSCRKYQKFGHRISSKTEKGSLLRSLNIISANSHLTKYINWPESYIQVIHKGFPSDANHVAICGIYFFTHGSLHCLVGDIIFIAEGRDLMVDYSNVPIQLEEVSKLIQKMPKSGGKKQIFVSNTLHSCLL
jgi:hypothetical protein